MTKRFTFLAFLLGSFLPVIAQNPGLLISEFLQNPAGTDSPFEYVELLAVDDIDFSVTPYTVIVSNNGTATTNGWVQGGSITYAFEITSGTVTIGDVVYVGGSSMAPSGPYLRLIDTGVSGGDGGIGNASSSGVFGNGGGNSDAIAVFNVPVSSVTSTTVPVDAVFYGDGSGPGHGGSVVNGGLDGYELPVNDLYSGGKLQPSSFLALDADLTVAQGTYDIVTNTFSVARTFSSGAGTDGTSEINLESSVPAVLSFTGTHATYNEDAGTITLSVSISSSNIFESSADVMIRPSSTATTVSDFVLGTTSLNFPPSSTGSLPITIDITDDMTEEQSEYIIVTLSNFTNAEMGSTEHYFVYITDDDRQIPTATNELMFTLLTSYSNGPEGTNSAEIVAYDSSVYRLFIANSVANNLDIVDFSDPSSPAPLMSINLDSVGSINSVAVYNGTVAIALENLNPQLNGYVSFFDADGNWLKRVDVGAMPDMLTFNADGSLVVVACEGEPADDYLTDPEGTVAVIDMAYPATGMSNSNVTLVNFNSLDGTEAALKAEGIRIYGPGASASQDFEPEYVTILDEEGLAYITLQENNALAVVDLVSKTLVDVIALGTIDHSAFGNGMDVSNVTSDINIANFPVKGMFLPDAISHLNIGGVNYLFTANEGDTRDYSGYSEETRIKDEVLDPTAFPDAQYFQDNYLLGRLIMTNTLGDDLGDGDFEEIYTIGTRSFSIWDASTGTLVFDSGDWIEQIIANDPIYKDLFNASNSAGAVQVKNRSDDKGPEVEGVTAAVVEGNHFVFVSLERVGGVFIFNVNDPYAPEFVGYENNRSAITNGPDRGAEGIIFIDAAASPNGNSLLLLANEISSTLTILQLNSCAEVSGLEISTENDTTAFCPGNSLVLTANATGTLTYQWSMEGMDLSGETNNTYTASQNGAYQVAFINAAEMCLGKTDSIVLTYLPVPAPVITVTNAVLSTGVFSTYQWYYEGTLIPGGTSMDYTPTVDGEYMVVVTNPEGCEGNAVYNVGFTGIIGSQEFVWSVYPNPANNLVMVRVNAQSAVYVNLTDMRGELIYEGSIAGGTQVLEINTSELAAGVYNISLVTENGILTNRLIIQK